MFFSFYSLLVGIIHFEILSHIICRQVISKLYKIRLDFKLCKDTKCLTYLCILQSIKHKDFQIEGLHKYLFKNKKYIFQKTN